MAHDEEFFEPKPGRSRRDPTGRTDKAPVKLMQRVARSGGNPRRLGSIIPPAKRAPSGRYNTRGRGAKISATIPRESDWSVDRASGSRFRMRRVTVKARYVKAAWKSAGRDHLAYLERDGVTREGEPGRLYSTFSDEVDRDAFLDRGIDYRHQFRFIIAPEDDARYADLKPLTRDLMARVEADLGTTLDWVAVDHHDTGHPHVHVIVRGVTEDGKTLNIAGDYIAYGLLHRASEILTRDLGHQTERELQRQLETEVDAERLTRLDRALIGQAKDGSVGLRLSGETSEAGRSYQQLLIARARQLERMKLATQTEPLRWSMSPGAEATLRAMGERGDIIKTMHRAMQHAGGERSPELYTVHGDGPLKAPIVGRVTGCGLADEMAERRYVIVDGIDGRSHYVSIGASDERLIVGSIASLSNTPTTARQADRTIADVAAANGGRYSTERHRFHDHTASDAYIEMHVRRLEAIRRATGGVERDITGEWRIAPDHIDRAARYEAQRAAERPVTIETLSPLPLQQQVAIDAPTWLDRQLTNDVAHDTATTAFGRDVRRAMAQRQQWLIEQGLMQRDDGGTVTFRRDLVDQLRRREVTRVAGQLSQELGLPFAETEPGRLIEGIYKRPIDLASGRYALIERSHEFSLVPWRPVLEKQLDRYVSGRAIGDSISWTLGRERDGPAI